MKLGKMFLLPGCVCAYVSSFSTSPPPHPTPKPRHPLTPIAKTPAEALPTSRAGGSGVGRGKRLNPSPWRLLLAAVGHSNEEGRLRGVGSETVPPVSGRAWGCGKHLQGGAAL